MQRTSHQAKRPSPRRDDLVARLGAAARHHQRAVDAFDHALVEALGLKRTDGRCVDVVQEHGPMTAGEMARACGLTTGAVTAVIDRLERAGMVQRGPDPTDRRKVIVTITPEAEAQIGRVFAPLVQDSIGEVARLTEAQLETVIRYLERDQALYERHAEQILERLGLDGPDRAP